MFPRSRLADGQNSSPIVVVYPAVRVVCGGGRRSIPRNGYRILVLNSFSPKRFIFVPERRIRNLFRSQLRLRKLFP